jgi:hypothetical protein
MGMRVEIEKGRQWKNPASYTAVGINAWWPVYVAAWPSTSTSTRH